MYGSVRSPPIVAIVAGRTDQSVHWPAGCEATGLACSYIAAIDGLRTPIGLIASDGYAECESACWQFAHGTGMAGQGHGHGHGQPPKS
jgi:hypothetical protein